ncbi:hypothetical protein RI367_003147 [Sorochytrium milnesiophthora]
MNGILPKLVSAGQLSQALKSPSARAIKILDGSWHMPTSGRDAKAEFRNAHLPGAQFFGIDDIKDTTTDLPHMLPTEQDFSKAIGAMGISNTDHIVVYDNNDVRSACRVYWSFRAFGHDAVSVLDGGLQQWLKPGLPTESGDSRTPSPATFRAGYQSNLVRNFEQVNEIIDTKSRQIVDARGAPRFNGTAPEPRPGMPSGHMPTAVNLPFGELLDPATGLFLSTDKLERRLRERGVDISKPITATCGSGITASVLLFTFDLLGARDLSLYDGSWTEWGSRGGRVEKSE